MLKDKIERKKINDKQKSSNEKKKQLKNKDQIERKKQIRGWIILDLKAKLKRKINFTKELKKKPPRE
jgi:hypothetical protein